MEGFTSVGTFLFLQTIEFRMDNNNAKLKWKDKFIFLFCQYERTFIMWVF